jgi:hypothetical protein
MKLKMLDLFASYILEVIIIIALVFKLTDKLDISWMIIIIPIIFDAWIIYRGYKNEK